MPRGAGGANRQDDVDEEGRGATRRNVGGHAVPRRCPLEIGLSAGCADPLIRQDLPGMNPGTPVLPMGSELKDF